MERTGSKRTDLSDRDLVELALKKDRGAFSTLLGKYRDSLIAHIMNYVNVVEDAEDICQRSFEKAFLNIDKYNPQYAFSTWLYSIAQNEAIDHLRRSRTSIASSLFDAERELMNIAEETPEDRLIVDQAVAQIVGIIHALPEKYRSVAELRFIKDYAYEDIADELGLPLGTVKTNISRSRKMLMKAVETPENGKDN